ncbi:hypothetical protein LINGRAHAP2_LOCUS22324 [Linum grandiflorum]
MFRAFYFVSFTRWIYGGSLMMAHVDTIHGWLSWRSFYLGSYRWKCR